MLRESLLTAVRPLVGLPLSIARRAGPMRVLHFGKVQEGAEGSWGEYALHIQCPWRVDGPAGVITGTDDLWEHPTLAVPPDEWDWNGGESRQDARIGALLGTRDERTRSWVNTAVGHLVVTAVDLTTFGDLMLALSGGYTLRLFPTHATEEAWRLLPPDEEAPHFVVPVPDGTAAFTTEA